MADARSDASSGARPDGGFDPDSVTGWTLVRAYHLVARRFHATLAEVGLTPTHFGVLVHVSQHPGTSQAALARVVLMTPQAMGEALTALEGRDLITRGTPRRGRPTPVALTDAGRAALQRAIPAVAAMNRPDALGLTPEQDHDLNALLHHVRRALDED